MRLVRSPVLVVVTALLVSFTGATTAAPAHAAAGAGRLVVRQTGLDFGLVPYGGTSPDQSVSVENTGAGPVAHLLVADPQAPFSITDNTCPATLGSGASCTVSYRVAVNAPGALSASSVISSNSGTSTVALKATGNPIGNNGSLAVSPTSLNFGDVAIGTTSAPQKVMVTNTAGGLVDFTVAGGGAGALFGGATDCGGSPKELAPGASCYFQYTFTPSAIGAQTGGTSIDVSTQGTTTTATIGMTGSGIAPLTISPTTLDFGQVVNGTTSAPQRALVTNTTSSSISFNAAGGGGGALFGGVTDCGGTPRVLAAGASCYFEYRYTPSKLGTETGAATIIMSPYVHGTAGTYSQNASIHFTGTAVASTADQSQPLVVSGTSFDFGAVAIGTTAPGQRLLVANTSAAPVSFSMAGGGAGLFGGVTDCGGSPKTLAAGASCYVQYAFSPTAAGPATGSTSMTLSLYTGATPDGRHIDAAVSFIGNGHNPLVVSGTAFDFGRILTGSSSGGQRTFVTNTTAGPVSFTIAGGGGGIFGGVTDCGGNPRVLAAGDSCYVQYNYTPTAIADQTGSTSLSVTPWVSGAAGTVTTATTISFAGQGWGASTTTSNVVSPNGLDFGSVLLGQSKSLSTVVRNDGATEVTTVTVTTPIHHQFVATGGTCLTAPSLGPGGICTVTYTYTPTAVGTTTDLAPVGSAFLPALGVALTGTGIVAAPPPPTVSPKIDLSVSTDQKTPSHSLHTKAKVKTAGGKELLVAFVEATGPTGRHQRVDSVHGGALTWHLASRANPSSGTSEVWYAYASAKFNSFITAALHNNADGSITVIAYKNAGKAPAARASGSGKGKNVVGRLTAKKAGSLVFAAIHDATNNNKPKPSRGQSLVHWFNDSKAKDSLWVQRINTPTKAGAKLAISTRLSSADQWTIALVEIPPA